MSKHRHQVVTEVQETCRRQLNQWPSSAVDSWERASRSPLRSQASQVIIRELPEFIDAARARLEKSLDGAVKRGKLDAGQRDATLANITFTSELKDVADREDIDAAMKLGAGHPMGPLTLCDFIGLDVLNAICVSLYEEFKRPEYAPPPLMKRMIAAGRLGRKSGKGFYDYA